jgi:spore coat polysaccharide biosynthesis predicted glycosyltransferase SpsG
LAANIPYELKLCENPTHMPELMNWADVAIAAAGSTTWELAFLGVPFCHIVVADNQAAIADHAARGGYAVNLGWHAELTTGRVAGAVADLLDDSDRRSAMTRAGRAAIDGQGALRVADMLQKLTGKGRRVSLKSGAA